jgi:hypothetical protein
MAGVIRPALDLLFPFPAPRLPYGTRGVSFSARISDTDAIVPIGRTGARKAARESL